MHEFPWDYLIHFSLEALGAAIGVYAYNFCKHTWHRLAVWFTLSALTTIITVSLVG
jgi:hypothetical protein